MPKDKMNLLVSFDKNYIRPFQTVITSLVINNPKEEIHIWLLHSDIPNDDLLKLENYCSSLQAELTAINFDRKLFSSAPISKRYPQEMYYRLLAANILPETIEKILYLDPDILVINPLRPLWEIPLGKYAFAAASHTGVTNIMSGVNRVRLGIKQDYFNSGIMLINLVKARELVKPDEIFRCVRESKSKLLLPDQDIFNFLYGSLTKQVDDAVWNYDARHYTDYLVRSGGEADIDWIMKNTAILHFCGKNKPWLSSSSHLFGVLYKHYMQLAARQR